jgi:hypothetical protein
VARSNAEVAGLMEFAVIAETLLIDADGVYDPSDVNDRMLPGLKSTMSEVELHVMAKHIGHPVRCDTTTRQTRLAVRGSGLRRLAALACRTVGHLAVPKLTLPGLAPDAASSGRATT